LGKLPSYSEVNAGSEVELICQNNSFKIVASFDATILKRWEKAVKRQDFNLELPEISSQRRLNFTRRLSDREYEWLKLGERAISYDDKWLIFWENDVIYFYRSWTGKCAYCVKIGREQDGYFVEEAVYSGLLDNMFAQWSFDATGLLSSLIESRITHGKRIWGF
jgi:hypothetical protein